MKINTSNMLSSVRSRMNGFSQNVRTKVKTRMNNVSERISTAKSDFEARRFMRAKAKREKEAERYVKFRNPGTYNTPITNELFNWREALASFAKAHGVTIDIYNPNAMTKEGVVKEGAPSLLSILVNNSKTGKMDCRIFDGNPSLNYPKERVRKFMRNVPGEEDLQTEFVGKFSVNDNPLIHIFRTLESMVEKVK